MCHSRRDLFSWEEEVPDELLPQAVGDQPQPDQVPMVTLQNMSAENYQGGWYVVTDADGQEVIEIVSSDSEDDESEDTLVISSCLNNPKVVWPSDTDSTSDDEDSVKCSGQSSSDNAKGDKDLSDSDMEDDEGGLGTACPVCGDSAVSNSTGSDGGVHNCPVWFLERGRSGRGGRGRNFARRSRPFRGK